MLRKTVSCRGGQICFSSLEDGCRRHATNKKLLQLLLSQLELHPKSWRISLTPESVPGLDNFGWKFGVESVFFGWKKYLDLPFVCKMFVPFFPRKNLQKGRQFTYLEDPGMWRDDVFVENMFVFIGTFGSGIWDGFCFDHHEDAWSYVEHLLEKETMILWRSILWSCH